MFFKLAVRNAERQLGNYLIYFITVSITVALTFALNSLIYSRQMEEKAATITNLSGGLIMVVVFVAVVVAFVLSYATSFMLKLRRREFGTYLTMGMTRRNIISIFMAENMIMCGAALAAGTVLGLLTYQGLAALTSYTMDAEIKMGDYSAKGLMLTIVIVIGMFAISTLASAVYLKRVRIYELIHAERVAEKSVRHPVFWAVTAALALAALISAIVMFRIDFPKIAMNESNGQVMMASLALAAVSIIIFHIAAAKSITRLMLRSRKLCSHGTNTFTLRQLSGKMSSNAVMAGLLAFLICFAVIFSNASFALKIMEEYNLNRNYAFDVSRYIEKETDKEEAGADGISPVSIEQGERIIEKYNDIESISDIEIYSTGDDQIYSLTPWSGDGYEGVTDTVISESDYNDICRAAGISPADLGESSFTVIANYPQADSVDLSGADLTVNGHDYDFDGKIRDGVRQLFEGYIMAVVPDKAVEGLEPEAECIGYELADDKYDAVSMKEDLTYNVVMQTSNGQANYVECDYDIKEYVRMDRNDFMAIFIIGAVYIAVVFIFMAMAMLALKTLSGISDDRKRYRVLFQIGADERTQKSTLRRQISAFFFFPFLVPVMMIFPTAYICGFIMELLDMGNVKGQMYAISAIIVMATAVLYVLYFTAAYLIARRNVVWN